MSEPDREPQMPGAPGTGDAARTRPPPRPRPRLYRTFVGIGIAVLLIGATGLGLSQLHIFNDPREAARAAEIAALNGDLQAMSSRLETLAHAASAANSDTSANEMAARVQDLEVRIAALENQIGRAADRDTLTAVQERLTHLEKDTAGAMLHRAATILAAANLARAAELGGPLDRELGALRTLAPNDPALSALEPLVDGVPSFAMLAGSFPEAARAAIQADAVSQAGQNPIGRFWANLRRLVSLRRIGEVDGSTNADRLARAQADLDRTDLSAAIAEVNALTGSAVQALEPWLKRAQARMTADRAIADMNRRVAQDLVLP